MIDLILFSIIPLLHTFIVFQNTTGVYAENQTGQIQFQSNDSSTLINEAANQINITNQGWGGDIYLINSIYLIKSTIILPNDIYLIGESQGATILRANSTISAVIRENGQNNNDDNIHLQSFTVDRNNGEALTGIDSESYNLYMNDVLITDYKHSTKGSAITIDSSFAGTSIQADNVFINWSNCGITTGKMFPNNQVNYVTMSTITHSNYDFCFTNSTSQLNISLSTLDAPSLTNGTGIVKHSLTNLD